MTTTARPDTPVYDQDVTDVYDLFYAGRGKSFEDEAAAVAGVVRQHRPDASSILDVACGTGEHLRWLAEHFEKVAGLELSPQMCDLARAKLPAAPIHCGDMRDIAIGPDRFDAVSCLTSSVGYMSTVDELDRTVASMAAQAVPGGVVVIDPWWSPEQYLDGHISHDVVEADGLTISRLSYSLRSGDGVDNEAHYVVAGLGSIRHFSHVQRLTLFTPEQHLAALERAGCTAEHVTDSPVYPDRGLFVGIKR
jgi:SAM-dependent methyltransferase